LRTSMSRGFMRRVGAIASNSFAITPTIGLSGSPMIATTER
jgi:hypothetical protein